jgi:hypothetical protein
VAQSLDATRIRNEYGRAGRNGIQNFDGPVAIKVLFLMVYLEGVSSVSEFDVSTISFDLLLLSSVYHAMVDQTPFYKPA